MAHANPLHHFIEHSTPTPTLLVGSQFALSPPVQNQPNPVIAALPAEGSIMESNADSSNRDLFSNNHIDDDSILLRGGSLRDGEEPQFQPDGPQQQLSPVNFDSNVVRGGSIAVVGPQTSKDLSEVLAHRVQMAKVKAKLAAQDIQ